MVAIVICWSSQRALELLFAKRRLITYVHTLAHNPPAYTNELAVLDLVPILPFSV